VPLLAARRWDAIGVEVRGDLAMAGRAGLTGRLDVREHVGRSRIGFAALGGIAELRETRTLRLTKIRLTQLLF
jgi:hypothetical protein